MTMRVHIERLVLDPRVLRPDEVPRFQKALGEALGQLHAAPAAPPARPRDAVIRLAESTAKAIQQRVARR